MKRTDIENEIMKILTSGKTTREMLKELEQLRAKREAYKNEKMMKNYAALQEAAKRFIFGE